MRGKWADITGMRFGRLVAICEEERQEDTGLWKWRFKCDCGNEAVLLKRSVMQGLTRSCGCIRQETCAKMGKRWLGRKRK